MSHEPNWYPDPSDPTLFRFWDGSNWTEHTAPRVPDYSEARPTTLASSISFAASLVGIAVLFLALSGGFACDESNCASSAITMFWILVGTGLALECLALTVGVIGRRTRSAEHRDSQLKAGLWISATVLGLIVGLVALSLATA
jgi:hypothetical protein